MSEQLGLLTKTHLHGWVLGEPHTGFVGLHASQVITNVCNLRGGNESDDNDECENTLKILKNPLGMMFVTASPFIVMPLVVIFQLIPSILTHLIVN